MRSGRSKRTVSTVVAVSPYAARVVRGEHDVLAALEHLDLPRNARGVRSEYGPDTTSNTISRGAAMRT